MNTQTSSTTPNSLDNLLNFDPLREAENVTGHSYKDDGGTSALGMLLAMDNNYKKQQALKANQDSYYGMGFAEFVIMMDEMGFKKVAAGQIPGTDDEWFIDWKEGILVFYDSFQSGINHATAYFNYLPVGENSCRTGFSGSAVEGPGGKNVWYGHIDVREGFKHRLAKCKESGVFMKKWIKQPNLWLLHYKDTKVPGYNPEEINRQRIALLPEHVQDAIRGSVQ